MLADHPGTTWRSRAGTTDVNFLLLSLRLAWRDWRAGELNLLLGALVIAVAAIASVGFFVDRMELALERQASHLLGADLVLASDRPVDASPIGSAAAGVSMTRTVVFPSMAAGADGVQLASVKAVGEGYPLRGRLLVRDGLGARADVEATGIPAPGEAWLDPQLATALGLDVGDEVELGERMFRIGRIISVETDRGTGFVNFAPRLMIAEADLDSTGLLGPASRASWNLLVAGEPAQVGAVRARLEGRLEPGQRLETVTDGRPELSSTLARAEQFLALVALLTALIAAVAVALGARRFAQRHIDGCAVMKAIGLPQGRLLRALVAELLWIALVGGLAGAVVGWSLHFLLVSAVASMVAVPLPPASAWPALRAIAASVVLLIGFGAWPFVRLAGVPPMRVLRRELGPVGGLAWVGAVLALVCFAGLMLWFAGDRRLAAWALAGFAAGGVVFVLAGLFAVRMVGRLRGLAGAMRSPAWRLAFASWSRRREASVAQVVALAIGLMALMLLTVTRSDLIEGWQRASPPDAPNRFVINIQPEQRARVGDRLGEAGIADTNLFPMVRGRLVTINGAPVRADDYDDDRAQRLVQREFNLSYMAEPPSHNKVVAGRWFDPQANEVSFEEGIMATLRLKVGDKVGFDIAGRIIEADLTSARVVAWDSMQVNFFAILSPALLGEMPQTWITAYHQPETGEHVDRELVREMPNLTVFDVGNILRQVQDMLAQVIRAVQVLFVLTLVAGIAVLYGALAVSRDERLREAGLMRALGASRRQLSVAQLIEIAASGALAGLLAAIGALVVGSVLAERVFDFELSLRLSLLPLGALGGALLSLLAGWLGLRHVLDSPPMTVLRDA
ncbi:MAG: FtsX-like permease family protein [Burkholderiaceae bacterium]|jgi:putative ABC transport system permease protein|nr:FtsX-like permease family protein [Burkholderiaceae bacterium]